MEPTHAPGILSARSVSGPGPVSEAHSERIRSFAFFPYRGPRVEEVSDPSDLGRRAWSDALKQLAELAEPEEWTGGESVARPLPILDSYVRYTHRRLVMEDKIAVTADGNCAAFNTGLLTPHGEEVFAFFRLNEHENAERWYFVAWITESSRELLKHFDEVPQMAEYVTTSSDLVYDWRRELKIAYDHILGDNLDRFPSELSTQPLRARQALDSAVNLTLRRLRRNYKIAIPQWYPKLGDAGAQFLMPLDLTGDGAADLALVVSAVGDRAYRGHTVLTLDMAYTNARLVARPDSDWLAPTPIAFPNVDEGLED